MIRNDDNILRRHHVGITSEINVPKCYKGKGPKCNTKLVLILINICVRSSYVHELQTILFGNNILNNNHALMLNILNFSLNCNICNEELPLIHYSLAAKFI